MCKQILILDVLLVHLRALIGQLLQLKRWKRWHHTARRPTVHPLPEPCRLWVLYQILRSCCKVPGPQVSEVGPVGAPWLLHFVLLWPPVPLRPGLHCFFISCQTCSSSAASWSGSSFLTVSVGKYGIWSDLGRGYSCKNKKKLFFW